MVVSGSSTAFRNGQETLGREKRLVMLGRSLLSNFTGATIIPVSRICTLFPCVLGMTDMTLYACVSEKSSIVNWQI